MAEQEPLPRTTGELAISYPGVCFDANGEVCERAPFALPPLPEFTPGVLSTSVPMEFRLGSLLQPPPASASYAECERRISALLTDWEDVLRLARAGQLAWDELEKRRAVLVGAVAAALSSGLG